MRTSKASREVFSIGAMTKPGTFKKHLFNVADWILGGTSRVVVLDLPSIRVQIF